MAQRVQILMVDDLDGSEATQTLKFGFDGIDYTIDLNDKNAEKLKKAIAPFLGVATRVGRTTGKRRLASTTGSKTPAREIREWARSNGHDVPDRGAIPAAVREAYEAAS